MEALLLDINEMDTTQCSFLLENECRKPNLSVKDLERLLVEHELNIMYSNNNLSFNNLIKGLVCLPNGNLVSCENKDDAIKVWDIERGECLKNITVHSDEVCCLLLLKNVLLASSSGDKTIKLWDISNYKCIKIPQEHTSDVNQLLQLDSGELISCSSDHSNKIWDVKECRCIKTLVGHTYRVISMSLSSQPNILVIAVHGTGQ